VIRTRRLKSPPAGRVQFARPRVALRAAPAARAGGAASGTSTATVQTARVELVAYTGGPMWVGGYQRRLVIDLATLIIPRQTPLLFDHLTSLENIIGQADSVRVAGGKLLVSGRLLGVTDRARQVIELGACGYGWQASVGADPGELVEVRAGEQVTVNGRTFTGPLEVSYDTALAEISMVAIGADRGGTSASVQPAPRKANKNKVAAALVRRAFARGDYRHCTPAALAAIRAHLRRLET
jgi:hypothetical protein